MNGFFFTYTIALILVAITAAALSLGGYAVSRRRVRLFEAAFFFLYTYELIGIFRSEWFQQNLPVEMVDYYGIEHPVTRTLESAAVLLCLWLIILHYLDEHRLAVMLAPIVAYLAVSAVVLVAMPYGAYRQFVYYTLRQVFLAGALLYAFYRYQSSSDEAYRQRLSRYANIYPVYWALIAVITIEDIIVIMLMPEPTTADTLPLYLSSRNISENFAMLFIAYQVIRSSLKALSLRFDEPPAKSEDERKQDTFSNHIEEVLPSFAARHGLSAREREILAAVIEGKDNRTIASELFLSEGTIKTHVHNIMVKTGTKTRPELKKLFWSA